MGWTFQSSIRLNNLLMDFKCPILPKFQSCLDRMNLYSFPPFTLIFFIKISFVLFTDLGLVCFVGLNVRVLSANRVDFGFTLINFSVLLPPSSDHSPVCSRYNIHLRLPVVPSTFALNFPSLVSSPVLTFLSMSCKDLWWVQGGY